VPLGLYPILCATRLGDVVENFLMKRRRNTVKTHGSGSQGLSEARAICVHAFSKRLFAGACMRLVEHAQTRACAAQGLAAGLSRLHVLYVFGVSFLTLLGFVFCCEVVYISGLRATSSTARPS
jgi:hypothetical protein